MWCCSSEFMVQGTWNPFSSPARRWQGIWPQIHLDSQQKTAKSQLAIWIRRWWSRYSLGLTGGFSPQRQKQMSSAFSRPLCQVWIISPVQFVFPLLFLLLPSVPHLHCALQRTLQRPYSCPPRISSRVHQGKNLSTSWTKEMPANSGVKVKVLKSEEGKEAECDVLTGCCRLNWGSLMCD